MRTISPAISKLTLDIKIGKYSLKDRVIDIITENTVEIIDNPTIIKNNIVFRFNAEFVIARCSLHLFLLRRHKKTREIVLNVISIKPIAILYVNRIDGSIVIIMIAIITIGIIDATVNMKL